MKKTLTFALGATLLSIAGATNAATWNPTDVENDTGDINVLNLSISGTNTFGLFDAGGLPQTGGDADLVLGAVDTVTFTRLGDDTWEIENLAGDTYNLGGDFSFSFGYYDGVEWTMESSAVELAAGSNIWSLSWADGVALTVIDVAPVPVPAAIWLLGSGIAGLLVMRRKAA